MAKVHGLDRNTLKLARQRMGTIPYKDIYYGNVPNLRTVNYQLLGAGRSQQTAVFDTTAIDDIDTWLTERLGELKFCRPSGHEPESALIVLADRCWQCRSKPQISSSVTAFRNDPYLAMIALSEQSRATVLQPDLQPNRLQAQRPRFQVRNSAPSSRSANGFTRVFGGAFGSMTNMIVEP